MKIITTYFFLLSSILFVWKVQADDSQANITFRQGSVLIICTAPEGNELTDEQFNAAFPRWIAALQNRANEGIVTRAHYLGELKAGIFIVVDGEEKSVAMSNALAVNDEMNLIFREATGFDGSGSCQFKEIGPVAILPQK